MTPTIAIVENGKGGTIFLLRRELQRVRQVHGLLARSRDLVGIVLGDFALPVDDKEVLLRKVAFITCKRNAVVRVLESMSLSAKAKPTALGDISSHRLNTLLLRECLLLLQTFVRHLWLDVTLKLQDAVPSTIKLARNRILGRFVHLRNVRNAHV